MRATSVVRRLNWIEQQRYHARQQAWNAKFNSATCQRCAVPVFDVPSGTFKYNGPLLRRVEVVHANAKQIFVRGICDEPDHMGPREDVIRVDFEHEYDDDDMDRALRSCVFFVRDSQQEGAK